MGTGDGSQQWFASSDGPIVSSSLYGGQTSDLTRPSSLFAPFDAEDVPASRFHASWSWVPAVWSPPLVLPNATAGPCTSFGCTTLALQMNGADLVRSCLFLAVPHASGVAVAGLQCACCMGDPLTRPDVQVSQEMPPIRVQSRVPAVAVYSPPSNANMTVVDFGQNFAGWSQLRLEGTATHNATYTIVITHTELLDWDTLLPNNFTLGLAAATDTYIVPTVAGCGVLRVTSHAKVDSEPRLRLRVFALEWLLQASGVATTAANVYVPRLPVRALAEFLGCCAAGEVVRACCRFVGITGLPDWFTVTSSSVVGLVLASNAPDVGTTGFGDDTLTRIGAWAVWRSAVRACPPH